MDAELDFVVVDREVDLEVILTAELVVEQRVVVLSRATVVVVLALVVVMYCLGLSHLIPSALPVYFQLHAPSM